MPVRSIFDHPLRAALLVAALTALHLLWDHVHGGIPTHYLLVSDDLPGFSNWWGLLTLPLLTWVSVRLMRKSIVSSDRPEAKAREIGRRCLAALAFGITLSILWVLDLENVIQYLILLPLVLAVFRPLHLPPYLLGFVLGMAFTFGGVLPLLFGTVILFLCFLIYQASRAVMRLIAKFS